MASWRPARGRGPRLHYEPHTTRGGSSFCCEENIHDDLTCECIGRHQEKEPDASAAFAPGSGFVPRSGAERGDARRGAAHVVVSAADPAWQRDSILLLAYEGVEDLLRNMATGVKAMPGFDLLELNSELAAAFVVAGCWLAAALITGVLDDEHRYSRARVAMTWAIAAPAAALTRVTLFSGSWLAHPNTVSPTYSLRWRSSLAFGSQRSKDI